MRQDRRYSLCTCSFHPSDVIYDSPIYQDHDGEFHEECFRKVEALIAKKGSNDIGHLMLHMTGIRAVG